MVGMRDKEDSDSWDHESHAAVPCVTQKLQSSNCKMQSNAQVVPPDRVMIGCDVMHRSSYGQTWVKGAVMGRFCANTSSKTLQDAARPVTH